MAEYSYFDDLAEKMPVPYLRPTDPPTPLTMTPSSFASTRSSISLARPACTCTFLVMRIVSSTASALAAIAEASVTASTGGESMRIKSYFSRSTVSSSSKRGERISSETFLQRRPAVIRSSPSTTLARVTSASSASSRMRSVRPSPHSRPNSLCTFGRCTSQSMMSVRLPDWAITIDRFEDSVDLPSPGSGLVT